MGVTFLISCKTTVNNDSFAVLTSKENYDGGGLTSFDIERVFKVNLGQIKECYEKSLKKNPGLSGRIKSRFLIGATGTVTESKIIESNMSNSEIETCVSSAISSFKFPPPRGTGGVWVNYPFVFMPSN